ncbi:uncharacterized protein Fot_01813 [Forsythia ovata]|uniref:NECAP PHear domain-containing protein n=1 Tax=Forsythia ovata TaxID=205694 RepID=A0ABD1X4W1_9LAMI
MSLEEDEETLEHTLLVVREVSIYKIPLRSSSGGYKCGEWLQSDKIWSGRLRVVSCKSQCEIRLEDPNFDDLFAACFVSPGQRESAVESWKMIYDVNSPLFRSFLSQKGGSSDKRKTEEQKPREQKPKANENKPVMTE